MISLNKIQKIINKKVKNFWNKLDSNKWIKKIFDLDIPLNILKLLALGQKFNLECLNKKLLAIKILQNSFEIAINYLDINTKIDLRSK